jgi:hypothetical protein
MLPDFKVVLTSPDLCWQHLAKYTYIFVQFDFVDAYTNVTFDTISALKFALGFKWKEVSVTQ